VRDNGKQIGSIFVLKHNETIRSIMSTEYVTNKGRNEVKIPESPVFFGISYDTEINFTNLQAKEEKVPQRDREKTAAQ
jgi:hypothetical protein